MRNAEDTPASGFARIAGAPGDSSTPDATGAPHGAPWGPAPEPAPLYPDPRRPRLRPGEAARSVPVSLPVTPPAPGSRPPAPDYGGEAATPRTRGPRPAPPRPDELAPRNMGASPVPVRSEESALRGQGLRRSQVRSGEPPLRSPGLRPPAAAPIAVPGRAASSAVPPPSRPAATALAQVPYLVVLACAVGGIVWAWRGSHAVGNGAGVVGGALFAAAVARLLLPQSAAGLLASRRRLADVLALGILGAGLLVLALVLPPT